jgi:hypothetical protein
VPGKVKKYFLKMKDKKVKQVSCGEYQWEWGE